jgi:hypothetical protein
MMAQGEFYERLFRRAIDRVARVAARSTATMFAYGRDITQTSYSMCRSPI